jgi:hypothetical protein
MLAGAVCTGLLASEARAGEDRVLLSLAPTFVAAASDASELRMLPAATPVSITERPGDSQKERLRRVKLYRTLGVAAAIGAAAVVGGLLVGPAYGTAAGAAVLIVYLILP